MPSFAHLFCQQRKLADAAYGHTALRACLHLPGRLLFTPINLFAPNFFSADLDLVNGAGWLTNPEDLDYEFESYRFHPFNRSRWRRRLGLCVSTRKVQRLVWRTLRGTTDIPKSPATVPPSVRSQALRVATPLPPPEIPEVAAAISDQFAHFPLRDHSRVHER